MFVLGISPYRTLNDPNWTSDVVSLDGPTLKFVKKILFKKTNTKRKPKLPSDILATNDFAFQKQYRATRENSNDKQHESSAFARASYGHHATIKRWPATTNIIR